MKKRKGYQVTPEMAAELEKVAAELNVPENAIINLALRQFIINHHKDRQILSLGAA